MLLIGSGVCFLFYDLVFQYIVYFLHYVGFLMVVSCIRNGVSGTYYRALKNKIDVITHQGMRHNHDFACTCIFWAKLS